MRRVDAGLIGVAAVWGSSYLVAQVAADGVGVGVVLFWRYALAAAACLAMVAQLQQPTTRVEARAGSVLGLTQAAVLALETYGVTQTSAANAGVLISLTIILTPILGSWLGDDSAPGLFLAAAVCVVGVAVLVGGNGLTAIRTGDVLILAAAVVRAGHVVLIGRLSRSTDLRPLHLTLVQTVVGGALFAPFAAHSATPGAGSWEWWSAVVYLALGCSVFAFLVQTWAVQRTSAARASLLLGTEPVWAVLVAVVLARELFGPSAVVGSLLIVGGCYWGQRIEYAHRIQPKEEPPCPRPTIA